MVWRLSREAATEYSSQAARQSLMVSCSSLGRVPRDSASSSQEDRHFSTTAMVRNLGAMSLPRVAQRGVPGKRVVLMVFTSFM